MSNTQDKRKQRKQEHAEFLWERAQLNAAMAKTQLDIAIETFKDLNTEMTDEQKNQTENKANEQYTRIKEFLMSEKELYLERMGILQD